MAYSVNFKRGTAEQYAVSGKETFTFYYVEDTKDLYLGDLKLSSEAGLNAAIVRLGTAEDNITANAKDIKDLQLALDDLTGGESGSIAALLEALKTELQGKIDVVQGNVNIVAGDLTSEVERAQGAEAALGRRIDGHNTRLEVVEGSVADHAELLESHTGTIGDHTTAIGELEGAVASLAQADVDLGQDIEDVDARVDVLVGDVEGDGSKSVRAIATEEAATAVAGIVAGADAKYDTLKEIADYLLADETNAAQMVLDIAANKAAHEANATAIAENAEADAALEVRVKANEDAIAGHGTRLTTAETTIGQHTTKIGELETADATNLAEAKGYTDTEVAKVSKAVEDASKAASDARGVLQGLINGHETRIAANETAIAAINNESTGILAQAKSYSDANLVTAKAYTDEQLTDKLTWKTLA